MLSYKLPVFNKTQEFFFFFFFNFTMHPHGTICTKAEGSEMSYGCCYTLKKATNWSLPLPAHALLICYPHPRAPKRFLQKATSQTLLHFSKLWSHLLGQCQRSNTFFVKIQKPGAPLPVRHGRPDLTACPRDQTLVLKKMKKERWAWSHH